MDSSHPTIEVALGESILEMDRGADTVINGTRTGIVDYAGHCGIHTRTYEVPIYRRLGDLLGARCYPTRPDVPYPGGSARECDLVATTAEGDTYWLEVKLLWREWLSTQSASIKRSRIDEYILGPGLNGGERSHSLAQDFSKLETLPCGPNTKLGVVGICFDSIADPLDPVIHRMASEQRLEARGWKLRSRIEFQDRNSTQHRIVTWFWVTAHEKDRGVEVPAPSEAEERVLSRLAALVTDPLAFEVRATRLLRPFLSRGSYWAWESWIAEIVALPQSHPIVVRIGARVREREKPYRTENYLRPSAVEALTMFVLQAIRRELRAD